MAVLSADCADMAAAANGSTEYRVEMTKPTAVPIPRHTTTMAIAGWVNLRKKGRTDKLSFGGLLSPLGRAIWWGSKTSISPLIHFSISA